MARWTAGDVSMQQPTSNLVLREFVALDYAQALDLWQGTPGLGLSAADDEPAVVQFLQRNPRLSWVWEHDSQVVATVLCGHDGRRGNLYHLAVASKWRGQGLAQQLVRCALQQLLAQGITKCHIMTLAQHPHAHQFWLHFGASDRSDLTLLSVNLV